MNKRYDINGKDDRLDAEKHDWIIHNLTSEQYQIIDEGFIYSHYVIRFNDPVAEIAYLLRWD